MVVHVKKPDQMVFAGFSASSWFLRGLRMHVHRTVAAGGGGAGEGIVSLFSRAASRDRLHSSLLKHITKILFSAKLLLHYIKTILKYFKLY